MPCRVPQGFFDIDDWLKRLSDLRSQKEGNYDAEKPMTQGYPQEMLDPELQDYVQRGVLRHPCVVSVFD